ncbi:MAG TPA: UDP-N-acetylmuramate dehydrogenase [Patescibacteria group bacterium]|nr:UDP-N-acetylmuramate dehydrogenase [Patescibacteria group bacterium]
MQEDKIQSLVQKFPTLQFQQDVLLAPYTYMKVGGKAAMFVEVGDRDTLFELSKFCFENGIEFTVIGGASNVVIPDEGIDSLVIRNTTSQIYVRQDTPEQILVEVDSGVITAVLANKTMEKGYAGLEYFVGVPGTIGGAIVNNSHFRPDILIGERVVSVEVCTQTGKRERWPVEKLGLAYDHSVFHQDRAVILSATFTLLHDNPSVIQERVREAAARRSSTQPIGVPSSGCMYKNPVLSSSQFSALSSQMAIPEGAVRKLSDGSIQVAAGFLIEAAGLKGTTTGGAQVSEKHATFLINSGSASANDVGNLCLLVESTVERKFGIRLEREVFFL